MLLSAGSLGDGVRGAFHPTPLCLTSRMLFGLLPERRALLTRVRRQLSSTFAVITQMRQSEVADVTFDERI